MKTNTARRAFDAIGYKLTKRGDMYAIIDHDTGGLAHESAPWGIHCLSWEDVEEWYELLK